MSNCKPRQTPKISSRTIQALIASVYRLLLPVLPCRLFSISTTILIAFWGVSPSHAQVLKIKITFPSNASSEALVEGQYSHGASRFSFQNSYGSALGLGDRIDSLQVKTSVGGFTTAERIAPGEFRTPLPCTSFRYAVKLDLPTNTSDMAHISWRHGDMGFLMLADLLPRLDSLEFEPLVIDFVLPTGWQIASAIPRTAGHFVVQSPDTAIFFAGRALREITTQVGPLQFGLVTCSKWSFGDSQVIKTASKVLREYARRIVPDPTPRAVLFLAPFPEDGEESHWAAETRGSTTAMIFNEGAERRFAVAQLGIALTHEFFHLWVPNGLALRGEYDWFFEGFTLYQALQTAVSLGYIDFSEYLNTIGRVYQSYLAGKEQDQYSLVEASKRRSTGGSRVVYDKGMLVAFLYDLTARFASDGHSSLDEVYLSLFKRRSESLDGNQAIINALSSSPGLNEIAQSYIVQNSSIELESLIKRYGLAVQSIGQEKHLVASRELNPRQLRLLRSLGFRH
ncbi:MAG TPA: hypothetical protein VIV66_16040 [Pyrinomonadaceae bacterium]